ncbi:hypothetical protein RCRUDOLPH_69 [Rhodobacter phage RcRudolph]|nr:hypothetical protein RCRUDOLPH_69 [Rhodobacter phage RcRudolph]
MKTVILRLSDVQAKALRELAEQYLDKGPAWECMQEWDEPYEASDLDTLKDELLRATEETQAMAEDPEPRYQLNLSEGELDVLDTLLDFHNDDEPGEYYPAEPFESMSSRVKRRDLIVLDR